MDVLVVLSWQESKKWVGERAWTRGYLADCLQARMEFREVDTKRLAPRLFAKEAWKYQCETKGSPVGRARSSVNGRYSGVPIWLIFIIRGARFMCLGFTE